MKKILLAVTLFLLSDASVASVPRCWEPHAVVQDVYLIVVERGPREDEILAMIKSLRWAQPLNVRHDADILYATIKNLAYKQKPADREDARKYLVRELAQLDQIPGVRIQCIEQTNLGS